MAGLDSYSYGNIIQTSSRLKLDDEYFGKSGGADKLSANVGIAFV